MITRYSSASCGTAVALSLQPASWSLRSGHGGRQRSITRNRITHLSYHLLSDLQFTAAAMSDVRICRKQRTGYELTTHLQSVKALQIHYPIIDPYILGYT